MKNVGKVRTNITEVLKLSLQPNIRGRGLHKIAVAVVVVNATIMVTSADLTLENYCRL